MKCGMCGADNEGNNVFCNMCGAKLEEKNNSNVETNTNNNNNNNNTIYDLRGSETEASPPQQKQTAGLKPVIIGAASVAAVILIFVIIFANVGRKGEESAVDDDRAVAVDTVETDVERNENTANTNNAGTETVGFNWEDLVGTFVSKRSDSALEADLTICVENGQPYISNGGTTDGIWINNEDLTPVSDRRLSYLDSEGRNFIINVLDKDSFEVSGDSYGDYNGVYIRDYSQGVPEPEAFSWSRAMGSYVGGGMYGDDYTGPDMILEMRGQQPYIKEAISFSYDTIEDAPLEISGVRKLTYRDGERSFDIHFLNQDTFEIINDPYSNYNEYYKRGEIEIIYHTPFVHCTYRDLTTDESRPEMYINDARGDRLDVTLYRYRYGEIIGSLNVHFIVQDSYDRYTTWKDENGRFILTVRDGGGKLYLADSQGVYSYDGEENEFRVYSDEDGNTYEENFEIY